MSRRGNDPGVGDLIACMTVVRVSEPFDAGQSVEVKFHIEPCHGLKFGSHMQIIIDAEMVKLYRIGDKHSIHMRPM